MQHRTSNFLSGEQGARLGCTGRGAGICVRIVAAIIQIELVLTDYCSCRDKGSITKTIINTHFRPKLFKGPSNKFLKTLTHIPLWKKSRTAREVDRLDLAGKEIVLSVNLSPLNRDTLSLQLQKEYIAATCRTAQQSLAFLFQSRRLISATCYICTRGRATQEFYGWRRESKKCFVYKFNEPIKSST